VKHHRRLVQVSEKELSQDVYYDDKDHEGGKDGGNDNSHRIMLGQLSLQGPDNSLKDAHDADELEGVGLGGLMRN